MKRFYLFLLILAMAAMLLVVPAFASAAPSGETEAVSAVVPDPSVESAIAAAEVAKATEAPAVSGSEASAEADGDESLSTASGEASGEASTGFQFNPGPGEFINVFSSALLLPLIFLSIILWFFRAYGAAHEDKNNVWLKIYKVLRKIHIYPLPLYVIRH